jgi:hypothetical protein
MSAEKLLEYINLSESMFDTSKAEFQRFLNQIKVLSLEEFPLLTQLLGDYLVLLGRMQKPEAFLDKYHDPIKHFGGKFLNPFYPLSTRSAIPHDIIDHCLGESNAMITPFADDYPSWRTNIRVPDFTLKWAAMRHANTKWIPRFIKEILEKYDFKYDFGSAKESWQQDNFKHSLILRLLNFASIFQFLTATVNHENTFDLNAVESKSELQTQLFELRIELLNSVNKGGFRTIDTNAYRDLTLKLEETLRKLEYVFGRIIGQLAPQRKEILIQLRDLQQIC